MDGFPAEDQTATEWSFAEPLGTPLPGKPRRRRVVPTLLATSLLVTTGAGVAIGHLAWTTSAPTASAASAGHSLTPSRGAIGSSGNAFPGYFSGGGASSGSNTGTGPTNAQSIANGVDAGLVDINTTLTDGAAAGTGMVITSDGVVLTNNHVIEGATSFSVFDIGNGKTYAAQVLGYDKANDVAAIKLENASGLTTVKTADSSVVREGDQVVAVGNAGGKGGTPSYAGGTITGTQKSITAEDDTSSSGTEQLTGLLATDAGIEPGDSGGPLVNTSGQVIGMDTAGDSSSGFGFGAGSSTSTQGFAIPIGTAISLVDKIVAGHSTAAIHIGKTAFLGVELPSASSGSGTSNGFGGFGGFGGAGGVGNGSGSGSVCFNGSCFTVPGSGGNAIGGQTQTTSPGTSVPSSGGLASGVQIAGVVSGEPAAKAGLTRGDTITAINGTKVTSSSSLSDALYPLRPGSTAAVSYLDPSGSAKTTNLTLAAGPPQ